MCTNIRHSKIVAITMVLFVVTAIFAHSGRTDSRGGHYNRKTGEYHYHGSRAPSYNASAPPTETPGCLSRPRTEKPAKETKNLRVTVRRVAVKQTGKIDVYFTHGGWPGAFITDFRKSEK